MAPQRLEKIESAPGNGTDSEASDPQDLVRRLTARGSGSRASRMTKIPVWEVAKLQKKGKRGKSPGVRDIWGRWLSAAVL
jgi:hypothetical protein